MNLASPGSTQLKDAVVVGARENANAAGHMPHAYVFARATAKKNGWPPIRPLPLRDVWQWLNRSPGFIAGFGGGATGRAINAFTHTLDEHDAAVAMFWAMVGIEALFTSGEAGLLNQVRERAQLLLGGSSKAARLIPSMYKVRSKLVHGKLDFGGAHRRTDITWDEVDKQRRELGSAIDIAVALLVSTLQECVSRSWMELQFSTAVSGVHT